MTPAPTLQPAAPTPGTSHPLVIFDGVCNFCSASVQMLIRNDRRGTIRYAPLQSPLGARLMREHGLDPADAESFLLIRDGRAYLRSDAAIAIARELRFPWRGAVVLKMLPRFLRDWAYGVIARNRYRWFGRKAACMIPTPEQRARFLDSA